jgi:hypothetical protein
MPDIEPIDRHDIDHIVRVVRAEYACTMDFGMTPGPEDYRIAIEEWLRYGAMPGEREVPGTTLGDLRRPDGTPVGEGL